MASHPHQIFTTLDGSATLIHKNSQDYEEKMHHSGGAWSETLYIYLPAMEMALETGSLSLMSLGLGLGYNEIIACALHLKNAPHAPLQIISFEASRALVEEFAQFFKAEERPSLAPCYEDILNRAAAHFELSRQDLHKHIADQLAKNHLVLRGPYPKDLNPNDRFNCILYDAFSNKMNPELWAEDFLKSQLDSLALEDCVFSTYAATGTIKRALRALNFEKWERPGFAGKRDSSFYTRGKINRTRVPVGSALDKSI